MFYRIAQVQRRLLLLVCIVPALLTMLHVQLAAAAPREPHCFPETGLCINGRFRDFWEQNGGLALFGFPKTPTAMEVNADTGQRYMTQWYERNRFELHPDNPAPYDVLLGRLGADRLVQLGVRWQDQPREPGPQPGCLWFPQTGHNVCNQSYDDGAKAGFKNYWLAEGLMDPRLDAYQRSLALHGLPLTAARLETNASGDTVITQWFERDRFEWHPSNPPGFRVQLGLLGNEVREHTAVQGLKYFVPRRLNVDLVVWPGLPSTANATGYTLYLAPRRADQPLYTLRGGSTVWIPSGQAWPVTVRGQHATAYATGDATVVVWTEDDEQYMIASHGAVQDILDLANDMEALDLRTWHARVGAG